MGKFTDLFRRKTKAVDSMDSRAIYQTFMTGPEWRNVDMADEYAAFLKDNKPFYRFPFFRHIYVFWKVFFQSYSAARRYASASDIIFSEYMLMNIFIGVSSTIEYAAKGLASLFLWPFLKTDNNTQFQAHVAGIFDDYAAFIHHTPFYNYGYFSKIGPMWRAFWQANDKSFADFISAVMVSVDFIARGLLSLPVGGWYNQEANQEVETIDVICKTAIDGKGQQLEAERRLNERLANVNASLSKESQFHVVSHAGKEHLFSRDSSESETAEKSKSYAYAHLRMARYLPFNTAVQELARNAVNTRIIAGNDHIQIRLKANNLTPETSEQLSQTLSATEGVRLLYDYQDYIHSKQRFFAIDVNTKYLAKVIHDIDETEGLQVHHIHDF